MAASRPAVALRAFRDRIRWQAGDGGKANSACQPLEQNRERIASTPPGGRRTRLATADELGKASVKGKIVGTAKGPKINGFTYKKKTNQRRRYGHRQHYTVVEITSITTS